MNPTSLAFAALLASTLAVPAAPRLVVSTPSLAPESKIDVVFDQAVVESSQLGQTTANDWLEVTPAIPGKLRWKAPNIAEWIAGSPPVMGTTYSFSIPRNKTHLDGSPVPAGKITSVASEEFRVFHASPLGNRWAQDFSPSSAAWLVVFNDQVDPASAAAFVSFGSKTGQRVAARLEPATYAGAGYYGREQRPWAARWGNPPAAEPGLDEPVPHALIARPLSPLPPGEDWQLALLKGLPNQSATARIRQDSPFRIGTIEPFKVAGFQAETTANEPRRIRVSFNHPLPATLPEDFLTTSVTVAPKPESLSATIDGRSLVLTGSLAEIDKYEVSVRPPFASADGLPLAAADSGEVKFKHLDPGIALPSDNQAQLASGSRFYQIDTVNIARLKVRIKKTSGTDLIRAYQGYRHYTGAGPDGRSISPTAPLPWPLIVGETIAEREIPIQKPVDSSEVVRLAWDELLPAGLRHAGLFLDVTGEPHPDAEAGGRRAAQALIQLTDLGLAWKLTPRHALVYAFSCDTGAPLPGVSLSLFGEDASPLEQATTTDASGLATLPRPSNARHLLATLGQDAFATAFDSTLPTVGLWHFPVRYAWNTPPDAARRAFLFTDRPLYRPGETVRLKGILRTLRGNAIEAETATEARLLILDPAEKEILSQPVTISPNGSFDFTHTLAAGKLGTHLIRLEFPDELARLDAADEAELDWEQWQERERILENARFEIPLRVEEFRRNAFEVTQKIAPPDIGASLASVSLAASYYQGQPVAAGTVKYFTRVQNANPYPDRFRDFLFGNHRMDDWQYWFHYFGYGEEESIQPSSQLQGETRLAADGTASIRVEVPQGDFPSLREVTVSSEVTDSKLQTLTASTKAQVHPASVYIGISRIDRLVRAGDKLALRLVAITPDHQPFTSPLALTATLTREVNQTVKSRNGEGETTTRTDTSEELVSTTALTLDPAASAKDGQALEIQPAATGLHFLTIRGTDPQGRPFATVTRFHVYGTNDYPWLYEDGMRVKLVAEKSSYQPGETARILILSPIEGTALVTVEREKVLRSFQVPIQSGQPVIEIPLSEEDAPNAFVSVLIVKGARDSARQHREPQLRLGYCELKVENRRDRLAVALDPPAESYRPGAEVTVSGSITLADGSPAAGAEVTLFAEDEGTLAVMGYPTPDPMKAFYHPRVLAVQCGTSFESFIPEDPENLNFHNKGFFIGGGGDLGKLADLLRRNFDPCATWAPKLLTDGGGRFSHTFRLPDTLTRYRVMAIAHHGASRFGHAESTVVASKDLMLDPKPPRFANQTDEIHPQVLIQNASRHAGTWTVEYTAHAADGTPVCRPIGNPVKTVSLAPGASATLSFPTVAEQTGTAVLAWKATPVSMQNAPLTPDLSQRLSDAVETRFEVHYPVPLLRQVRFLKLQPNTAVDLARELDPSLLAGKGALDLEFARSPLAEAAGAIDFLLHYPHGCVEQTTSSLIPWCAVEPLRRVIPAFDRISEKRVRAALQAGADRLLSMQLPNGSFSYWPGSSETVDWATPYAAMGLVLASAKGASVPASAIDSLAEYLIGSLRGMAESRSATALETHARTLLVLSLAGKPQAAYLNALGDRAAELTPAARALLAAAIVRTNPEHAATARRILKTKGSHAAGSNEWTPEMPTAALELLAWTSIDPQGPEALAALDRLFSERNPYGHWRTTWANGWSLVAVASYAEHEAAHADSVAIRLDSPDGPQEVTLSQGAPTARHSLSTGPNFKLTATASGPAVVRLRLAAKPAITPSQPVARNGLAIDRIYQRLKPDGTTEPLTEPRPGDLVRVLLRITLPKDDTRYLVIEDPLPALFESINSDFASQRAAAGIRTAQDDWNVSHTELRDDRAVFFLDHVPRKGTYTVSYLARCTLAGQAFAPPAKVESMYDPDAFALSASRRFLADRPAND